MIVYEQTLPRDNKPGTIPAKSKGLQYPAYYFILLLNEITFGSAVSSGRLYIHIYYYYFFFLRKA